MGVHCDDCSRPVTFPFPVTFYGQTFTSANVQSNGGLNFDNVNTWAANGCLPRDTGRAILVLWDDLLLTNSGQDAFTAVVGSAPNRQFVIEWRGHYGTGGLANFEVIFNEANGVIRTVYGPSAQKPAARRPRASRAPGQGLRPQFHCNEAGTLAPGLAVILHAATTAASAAAAASTTSATATASAATTATAATAATATTATGALPGAAGDRAEAGHGEDEDPRAHCSVGRIRRAHSRRVGPRHLAEPAAGHGQAPRLPGEARRRPPLSRPRLLGKGPRTRGPWANPPIGLFRVEVTKSLAWEGDRCSVGFWRRHRSRRAAGGAALAAGDRPTGQTRAPIEAKVLRQLATKGDASFWVVLAQKADVSSASRIDNRSRRGEVVYDRLTAFANQSQAPLRALLDARRHPLPAVLDRQRDPRQVGRSSVSWTRSPRART